MAETLEVKVLYDPADLEVDYVIIECDDQDFDNCERCRTKPLCDSIVAKLTSIKIGALGFGGEGVGDED